MMLDLSPSGRVFLRLTIAAELLIVIAALWLAVVSDLFG
jgi:hypothetical protein